MKLRNIKKAVDELSVISRELNEKGADYQVDFGYLRSFMNPIFDFDVKGQIFNFKLYPNELKNNLYKHKYYNTIEKKKQKIKQILFKCDCSIIIQKLNIFLFMTQKMVRKLQMQCLGIGIVFL